MGVSDGTVLGASQIFGLAPPARAFNVVLLADGFTAAQQPGFDAACQSFVAAFTSTAPFDSLQPAINIFRINVQSLDSGADDPATAGGTGAVARTYFDSSFGGGGLRRLLLCNESRALLVAADHVPEFTVAVVIVNSLVYGGSGGSVSTYSLAAGATEIAIHEMGHTAFGLADEYAYYAGGAEVGHDRHPPGEPAEPNVTTNANRATLKWSWAVGAATPVPTLSNPDCSQVSGAASPVSPGTVGLFEGAHYYHCGAFRPEFGCKMATLGQPFCAVCRHVIRNRIGALAALHARPSTLITALARYPDHLDVFAVGDDNRTMGNWWDGHNGWAGWVHVQGGLSSPGGEGSPVTGVRRYPGRLDVFTVGLDNRVYTASWDATTGWVGWIAIDGVVCRPGSTVTAVSRFSTHLDIFTTASDGRVMAAWWDEGVGWSSWFQVLGGLAAAGATVSALARYPFNLDVFTVGLDNRVYGCWWDERVGWQPWFALDGIVCRPDSTITAVARHSDQIDLFTTAADGRIMSRWWNGQLGWGPSWFQIAGGVASPGSSVAAVARYSNHLDLFTVAADARVWGAWWHEDQGWAPWFVVSSGASVAGGHVAALARASENIDLFMVGADGRIYGASWSGAAGWGGWSQVAVT